MKKIIYYAVFLSVTAMFVTLVAYLGYHYTAPIIEQNTNEKIKQNIELLYDPEAGYTRNDDQSYNAYRQLSPEYKEITDIYEVLDSNGDLYVIIYDMAVQGRNDIIHALVAVNPYTSEIDAVIYYSHAETPNLGERYTREEEFIKLVGQSVDAVDVDAIAGATTTWTSINTMFDKIKEHYNNEEVHIQ